MTYAWCEKLFANIISLKTFIFIPCKLEIHFPTLHCEIHFFSLIYYEKDVFWKLYLKMYIEVRRIKIISRQYSIV